MLAGGPPALVGGLAAGCIDRGGKPALPLNAPGCTLDAPAWSNGGWVGVRSAGIERSSGITAKLGTAESLAFSGWGDRLQPPGSGGVSRPGAAG
jgi:hypothetical protein